MSQWIWKFGEFEVYHNLLLHNRRQQYGYPEPVVWKLYAPEPVVCFKKEVTTEGGSFRVKACGNISVTVGKEPWNQKKYGGQSEIKLEPVGTYERFRNPDQTPEVFPFAYDPVSYVKKEQVRIQFGESREEALDADWSVIHFDETPENGDISYMPYAFRYIFVSDEQAEIQGEYEYLPLEDRGEFRCDEEIVNKVWEVAAYTFHLNSREFFLDHQFI